jgi:hypothetical protein
MPVMDVGPMNMGMDDRFVNMLVFVRLCYVGIHKFMLMMFVVDMRMAMGKHHVLMKMAVHFSIRSGSVLTGYRAWPSLPARD